MYKKAQSCSVPKISQIGDGAGLYQSMKNRQLTTSCQCTLNFVFDIKKEPLLYRAL